MKDFASMTNEQLIEEMDRLWRSYMYYMAAEGNWSSETNDRQAVTKEYYACIDECKKRDIETP